MAMFRKAAEFLGLVDDDVTDDYELDDGYLDDGGNYDDAAYGRPEAAPRTREPRVRDARAEVETGRPDVARAPRPQLERSDASNSSITVVRGRDSSAATPMAAVVPRAASIDTPAVRAVPAAANVHLIEPRSFNDAQEIGDRVKAGQPVIMNLQANDRELQRRLIDFASGLCYGLSGTMSKAADHVFLLTPANVDVSDAEVERLSTRGLYRAN